MFCDCSFAFPEIIHQNCSASSSCASQVVGQFENRGQTNLSQGAVFAPGGQIRLAPVFKLTRFWRKLSRPHPRLSLSSRKPGLSRFSWERCSERLASASLIERSRAELSPSGYGIHWPLMD